MSKSALKRRAREARNWLMDSCFPLWSERGVGEHGLFREILSLDHQTADQDTTRVRVQARQTYVFTEALKMGWKPDMAADHIAMGLEALMGPCLQSDGLAGRVLDSAGGGLTDNSADLYDTAFVLFALAETVSALDGAEHAREAATGILKEVDAKLRAPDGGYFESLPADQTRHQNPHMHLLEACLALHRADPDGDHLARAGEIVSLFDRFFTAGPGDLLGEHFAPGWTQPAGRDADIVEPGHQFEWVWLLHAYARASGTPVHPRADKLYAFACSTLDDDGRALQEVTREGAIANGSRRTWPQTEALKAHLAMFEVTDEDAFAAAACRSFDVLMDEYLTPEGGWIDQYDSTGKPMSQNMPASTGYHVVLAMAELMRIMDA
jgi:mannose/cellobiose epimerase-like protein (N-acyl-D-glucosamine 2-epimerase family)